MQWLRLEAIQGRHEAPQERQRDDVGQRRCLFEYPPSRPQTCQPTDAPRERIPRGIEHGGRRRDVAARFDPASTGVECLEGQLQLDIRWEGDVFQSLDVGDDASTVCLRHFSLSSCAAPWLALRRSKKKTEQGQC